jgi:hypothetical protein
MRTAPRQGVSFRAHIRDAEVAIMPVQIVDLSTDGCRLRSEGELESATEIWVKLPGVGARLGRIVWCSNGFCGVEFAEPIEAGLFDRFFPLVA